MGEVVGGRFELLDVLDAGGSGTVWRVWDHHRREYVAAKVLRHSDSDSLLRFIREARRVIDHPHVVAPRDWIGQDDRILFTMDLIRGGSVATLLGDYGSLPRRWAIELTRQTAAALGAVHASGHAHRDVKPSNLLLEATGDDRPVLRLSDFGTSAAFDAPRLTVTASVLGTPGYLSPEARSGADPAPAQDIYALGVVLRQLLTGSVEEPSPRGSDGDALLDLCAQMTAADVAERPATAHEVQRRLGALGDLGERDDPDGAAEPIEIFDHIPPLPAGWGPRGPLASPRTPGGASSGRDPLTAVLPAEPVAQRVESTPAPPPTPVGEAPAPPTAPPLSTAPRGTAPRATALRGTAPSGTGPGDPAPARDEPPAAGRPGPPPRRAGVPIAATLLAVLGVVLIVVAFVLA